MAVDNTQLKTGSATGTQITTQTPQSATGPAGGTKSNSLQPGTATTLLNSSTGIQLQNKAVPTIQLPPATATVAQAGPSPVPAKPHHVSPVLISLPVILVLVALVMFWQARRSVKSTTYY